MLSHYIKTYLATLVAFLVLDGLWLGLVARAFYRQHLGYLMAPHANALAAALFYLLFVAAVLFFVVKGMNSLRKKEAEAPAQPEAPNTTEALLAEIRDLLAKRP
jgi:uncharacterized membrane protein